MRLIHGTHALDSSAEWNQSIRASAVAWAAADMPTPPHRGDVSQRALTPLAYISLPPWLRNADSI